MDQEQSIRLISDEGEGSFRVILVDNLNPLVEEIGADIEVEIEESDSPNRKRMKTNNEPPVVEHNYSVDQPPLAGPPIMLEPFLDSSGSDTDGSSSRYIVTLGLKFHGEEYYLLQNQFRLPNLKTLFVSPSGYGMFAIATTSSCQILQQLLIVYGRTLKTLEVTGVWNFHYDQDGYYPVEALETLNLTKSFPATLQSLLILYGPYISTLELYDIYDFGDEIEGEECYLPNIKHLHIDADSLAFFELVRCNTEHIESLIVYLDDPEMDYDPGYLEEFTNLKLLEVNCPMVLNAILESCNTNRKLRYLYVPEQGEKVGDQDSLSPIHLPGLKDLCVRGSKKWSLDMIRKHCESLEYLIIFGFMELEEFRNCEDFEHDNEYHWPDLAALNCRFPKMKKLFLPDCTDNGIIQSLTAKCPANVDVITGKKEVGEAVAARIKQSYSYTRYKRMMHRDLSSLFQFN